MKKKQIERLEEYKILVIDDLRVDTINNLEKKMNKLGEAGWKVLEANSKYILMASATDTKA